jgi:hypothetical protein
MKRIGKQIFIVSIAVIMICPLVSSTSAITRGQVKAIAEYYKNHTWTCISGNANPTYNDWVVGTPYVGVAYNWGGFDMVEQFKTKINNGVVAGDSKVFGTVHWDFGGVDCSGFVSRCWELDYKRGTTTLSDVSISIGWADLLQGDITNRSGYHVRLFDYFTQGTNYMMMYEATVDYPNQVPPVTDKVVHRILSRDDTYIPRRYNNIINDYSTSPVSTKFNSGNHVKTTAALNMRSGPGLATQTEYGWDNIITTLSLGAGGEVLSDPGNGKFSYGYYWWYVQFGDNRGWCVENWLALDNPPTVNAFNVSPPSVTLGNSFTISYTVSDDIGLNRVELWDSSSSSGVWQEIKRTYISGTYNSGSFFDAPASPGSYWYGVHVVDNADQWNHEPDPPGPAHVTVTPTGIDEEQDVTLPKSFELYQNYPNPFNPTTVIEYDLPKDCKVQIVIYNMLGQKVRILIDQYETKGRKKVLWDSKDDQDNQLASGIYFYRLQAGDYTETKQMVLLK